MISAPRPFLLLALECTYNDTSLALYRSSSSSLSTKIKRPFHPIHHETHTHISGEPRALAHCHANTIGKALHRIQHHGIPTHIALATGPGLATCLNTGLVAAKTIAGLWNAKIIPVHHMEAHLWTPLILKGGRASTTAHQSDSMRQGEDTELPDSIPEKRLPEQIKFPFLALLISGGHTILVHVRALGDYTVVCASADDAVGEAFDKVSRYCGMGDNGHKVEQQAALASECSLSSRLVMTLPFRGQRRWEAIYSFSGLKAHAKREVEKGTHPISEICRSFQEACVDHIKEKSRLIFEKLSGQSDFLVISGGCARNKALVSSMRDLASEFGMETLVTTPEYCTDNAAMIGAMAMEYLSKDLVPDTESDSIQYHPDWKLDDLRPDRYMTHRDSVS